MVRALGIEPRRAVWKTAMLPLNIMPARSQRRDSNPHVSRLQGERPSVELRWRGACGESRTRLVHVTSVALVRTSIAGIGWTDGDSNPDLLVAGQACSLCHYQPLVTLIGIEPMIFCSSGRRSTTELQRRGPRET